ncbi:MAG: hypothetical protein JSV84_10285 [Gemmatimonadota bacterium]|nr:MAG: hypothetical protein JSV84_10285 [Gemmatimonadota bacterium]
MKRRSHLLLIAVFMFFPTYNSHAQQIHRIQEGDIDSLTNVFRNISETNCTGLDVQDFVDRATDDSVVACTQKPEDTAVYFIQTGATDFQCADCNGDGPVNILDAITEINCILGVSSSPCSCDCNNDGADDVLDVLCIVNIILNGFHFVSNPNTSTYHNDDYSYKAVAQNITCREIDYTAEQIPAWLTYDPEKHEVIGLPTADNLGNHPVLFIASNGQEDVQQSFTINVQLREVPGECWARYSPYGWPHDGQPFPFQWCQVHSDGANDDVKQQIGEISDQKFDEILQLFNFDDLEDFLYPPDYDSIQVFVNRFHPENLAAAYWGCYIITIRPSHMDERWYNYALYTVKHELMHVFEFLIEGTVNLGTDVWFREGIAVDVGDGFEPRIDLDDLEVWIEQNQNVSGHGNPIAIHQWEDFPEGADIHYYYAFFELTMEYLLDERGQGKSHQDVLNLFYDMRNGIPFSAAFQTHFGISLEEFENQYYDLMRSYLSGSR